MACSTLRGSLAAMALAASSLLVHPAQAAVLSSLDAVPPGWSVAKTPTARGLESDNSTHVFTIALALQNTDQLESKLLAASTPGTPTYGSYLDIDEIASLFGPSDTAVAAVTGWLDSSSVVQQYAVHDGYIDVATTLDGANELFSATYAFYTHESAANTTKLRTLSYAVPDDVAQYIALVDPGNYFGIIQAYAPSYVPVPAAERARRQSERRAAVAADHSPRRSSSPAQIETKATATTIDAACQTSITPACLKQLYNIGNYTPSATSGAGVGFGSFLGESAIYNDTFLYEKMNGIPHQNFSVFLIANATNDQDIFTASYSEADLDVQNIIGISHPLPVTEYITGGSPPILFNIDQPTEDDNYNEPYVPFLRYLMTQPNSALPQVLSISYGDQENGVPYNYAVQTCDLIGLLGLRGITVLFSSGDIGVGAGCLAPDYKTVQFNAIFPATCPYVTSVGGTVDVTPEIAWEGSSGGFSNYFSRPAFQDKAVSDYLQHVSNETYEYYAPYANWSGRGFPDVAGHSVSPDYQVVYFNDAAGSGGTSAAAPVWAGIIGLLNDARFRRGLPALGWLNPLLYAHGPEVLTDITDGYSIGCNGVNYQTGSKEPAGAGIVPGARWNATTGWDPVTGYGTPDFQKLLKLVAP